LQNVGYYTEFEAAQYRGHMLLWTCTLMLVLAWQGLYHRDRLLQRGQVMKLISQACLTWTVGFLFVALAMRLMPEISRIYVAVTGALTLGGLIAWRYVFDRTIRSPQRLAVLRQRTLVVGWTADSLNMQTAFLANREHAFEIVGWVGTGDTRTMYPTGGVPCLGFLTELESIIAENNVDIVVLSDLTGPKGRAAEIANICDRELVKFKIIPACFRIFISGLQLENVAGTPMLGIGKLPLDDSLNVFIKRFMDVVGAIFGLLASAPIMAVFGACVWLESKGPIFYRQIRTGASGRPFTIFKIRSMKLNAESNGAQWAKENDPRRLKVGAFMRAWNIDELPQFWNVLIGDMSLVGPRPERPELIADFKYDIPHYNARHAAKPGMTGWAAIKGLRGDTDLGKRILADLWYLENWTLWLDFQIMFQTFARQKNAY
jgi:exopolysaccharide biosynthesis polyprenyl glycosylphosphotransferase